MISTRSGALVIDTVVCLTLAKWETVSGRFGGYLSREGARPHLPTERRLYGACLRGGYNQRSTAPGDFNEALIGKMKRGAYLVNTARGKFCEPSSVHLKEGSLPAMQATSGSRSHHRRITLGVTMPYHRMTPHTSGTSLSPRLDTRLEPEKSWNAGLKIGRSGTSI